MPADRVEDIKIPPIRNGTVIDHITDGQSLNVLKILGVNENNIDSSISIGIHVSTNKAGMKWKDIVKLEDMELDPITVSKIALIAPQATISIIRDYYIAEKFNVKLDESVTGIVKCSNPNCITNKGEPILPEFEVTSKYPVQLKCCYCEKVVNHISDNLL